MNNDYMFNNILSLLNNILKYFFITVLLLKGFSH